MKPWIFALGLCLLTPVVSRADVTTRWANLIERRRSDSDEVEPYHWSLPAVAQLNRWSNLPGITVEDYSVRSFGHHTRLTRHEIAIDIARAIGKFGYTPRAEDFDKPVDVLSVRDVLVALVFEYRDELAPILVGPEWEPNYRLARSALLLEDYLRYKEANKQLTADEWYTRFQEQPWTKEKHETQELSDLEKALEALEATKIRNRVMPPPRLTNKPLTVPNVAN